MHNYICSTCGVQYAASEAVPGHCIICEDERQYVNPAGQQWTTLDALRREHHNVITALEPGLYSIKSEPKVAIGQTAHLVQTPRGNVLWDCITLLDDDTIKQVQALGGISAIALSHPHYYSTIVEWSHAFGGVPIYIHAADYQWVTRPDPVIDFWEGDTLQILEGLTLIHCAGHFEGSAVMHWAAGAEGKGVLLTGDSIDVAPDARYVSFMRSYPNLIPMNPARIRRIVATVEPFAFDRIYEAFGGVVTTNAKESVRVSAERYIKAITD
ncbi:MAG: MBL fold metallo-hydrolase [Anaerolineae bacterium]